MVRYLSTLLVADSCLASEEVAAGGYIQAPYWITILAAPEIGTVNSDWPRTVTQNVARS